MPNMEVSAHPSHTCFSARGRDLFSLLNLQKRRSEMTGEHRPWQRYCEAFWRAHHEAWKRSDLNQREYCEAQGVPLKGFGNWRGAVQGRAAAGSAQTPLQTRR